jgi:hypothetical protein
MSLCRAPSANSSARPALFSSIKPSATGSLTALSHPDKLCPCHRGQLPTGLHPPTDKLAVRLATQERICHPRATSHSLPNPPNPQEPYQLLATLPTGRKASRAGPVRPVEPTTPAGATTRRLGLSSRRRPAILAHLTTVNKSFLRRQIFPETADTAQGSTLRGRSPTVASSSLALRGI